MDESHASLNQANLDPAGVAAADGHAVEADGLAAVGISLDWAWRNWFFQAAQLLPLVVVAHRTGGEPANDAALWVALGCQTAMLLVGAGNCLLAGGRLRFFIALLQALVSAFLVPMGWQAAVQDLRWSLAAGMVCMAGCVLTTPYAVGVAVLVAGWLLVVSQKVLLTEFTGHLPVGQVLELSALYAAFSLLAFGWRLVLGRLWHLLGPVTSPPAVTTDHSAEILRLTRDSARLAEERQELRLAIALHVARLNEAAGFVRTSRDGSDAT